MAGSKYSEAQKLILFVQKAPFAEEEKQRLIELLNTNGMTDESMDEVHKALADIPKDNFKDDWQHAKFIMDLNLISKQWQLSHGSKNFRRTR